MPDGRCLKCGKPILQGILPHYCEDCLKELGLEYHEETKKALEMLRRHGLY